MGAALVTTMHVQRAVDGDEGSTAWLVERLNPLLLAQARWRLGPLARGVCDPFDLVQEAWLTVLPKLSTLTARDGRLTPVLLSYLSSVILNKVQNLLRREARRRVHHEPEATQPRGEVASPATGVVSAVVRRERGCQVQDALAELSEQDRQVILMRGIEQQGVAEVARYFEVSDKALSKRYGRALERLRAQLPDSVFAELHDD